MCGIAGFIDLTARRAAAANDRIAKAMHLALGHRGPDSFGVWSDRKHGVWLGHRRLAIVDLTAAGAQPMITPDGSGVMNYNGEIYNAEEVRPELAAAGWTFRGHSDTEILLYACRQWGVEGALQRLTGMFVFAYWDAREGVMTLARDRLGKKPLYWARTPGAFLFASELKGLMAHPDCPREVDRDSVAAYLRRLYVPAPHSILKGVHKLEPGRLLAFKPSTDDLRISAYWTVADAVRRGQAEPFTGDAQEAVDEAERLLRLAVRQRMISDVPFGAFLSGGVDSSAVVALMQQEAAEPVRTFSIGFRSAEYDESADAEAVARHLGCRHETFRLDPPDALEVIPKLAEIYDEPFADASQIPTYLVARMARRHVTVALSGDGGDEVFAGYNRHVAANGLLGRLGWMPRPIGRGAARALTAFSPEQWQALFNLAPARLRPRRAGEQMHKLAGVLGLTEGEQYRALVSHWREPEAVAIGGRERPDAIDDRSLDDALPDPVAKLRYLDLVTYLPDDILTKVDRATMAVSLESRAPLLDHRLVEFSWRVPSSVHLTGGEGKWILKQILGRHLPKALFDRPKSGFSVPIAEWLRGPLRGWAEDLLSEAALREAGLVRPEPVRAAWSQHLAGGSNREHELWGVLMLQAWRERHAAFLRAPFAEPLEA